jgi:acetolactate synthase-1/3 small subunit
MATQHILSVLVQDHPGILAKIAGLFSRRGFNIESLAVGHSEKEGFSRMTIVVGGDDDLVDQVARQLDKLVEVLSTEILPAGSTVQRELILMKIRCTLAEQSDIIQIANIFRANIVDAAREALTLELSGQTAKLNAFIDMLRGYPIETILRTGLIAVERSGKSSQDYELEGP